MSGPTDRLWVRPERQLPPRAAPVLLVGGLNNSPESLLPLAGELAATGYSVRLVPLPLSQPSADGFIEQWRTSLEEGYSEAFAVHSAPPHAIGYSLGATMIMDSLSQEGRSYRSLTLLAPALIVRRSLWALRCLRPLAVLGFHLPSVNLPRVRERRYTPLRAYAALFDLLATLSPDTVRTRCGDLQPLWILSTRDELIASHKTAQQFGDLGTVLQLAPIARSGPTIHHLLLDEDAVGTVGWGSMLEKMYAHLERA